MAGFCSAETIGSAFYGCANSWRAHDRDFQFLFLLEQLEHRARYLIIYFRRPPDIDRIANHKLQAGIGELELGLRYGSLELYSSLRSMLPS